MRILHVLDKLSVDGSKIHGPARQLSYRVPCYDPQRCEVLIVSLRGEEPAADLLRQHGLNVRCLGRSKLDPRTLTDLRRLIREWRPDLLHLSGYGGWNFGRLTAAWCRLPVILQEHFVDAQMPWYQRVVDWCLRGLQAPAIAVSDSVREFMVRARYVDPERITVIGNGVPSDRLRPPEPARVQALQRGLGLAPSTRVIGTVGRLAEMKGHTFFLQAAKRVSKRISDVAWIVIGEGPLGNALRREAEALGIADRVRFVGYQADVMPYLALCDVSVIPSIYGEGFCSVGIESFAAGVPVVMTSIAAVEGTYEHRKNALIVPPRDAKALAEAILELLTCAATTQALIAQGRRTLEAHGISGVAEHYLAWYERSLREFPRRNGRASSAASVGPRTLRVCLLTGSFYPVIGGGETYARNVARHLAARGVDIFVLTRRIISASPRTEVVDGVPVIRVGPSGKASLAKYLMLPTAAAQLWRRRHHYDVLLVSNFRALGPFAVVMAKLLGKRCVLRAGVCGEFSGEYITADGGVSRRALSWLAAPLALRTAVLRRADGFISNCAQISEEFERHGVARQRITLMPGGVDTERFQPATSDERARLRAQLRLPSDRSLIGYSGKLNRGKGIDHLIAALPLILKRQPAAHLVLIGGGANQSLSQEHTLRAMVRDAGLEDRVTFTGYVQNVPEHLRSLDVFVLPTEHEALPNALMEAMASGLPCVATRVGGIPDLIEDGVSGRLIEPGDVEALARALIELWEDAALAQRYGLAARRTIEARYSLDELARRHVTFLSGLMNGIHAAQAIEDVHA